MKNAVRIRSDELSQVAIIGIVFLQLLLNNGIYLFLCYAVLLFLLYQVSQPYKPAVFTIVVINHILQIVAGVWQANYLEQDLNYRSFYTKDATVLSLIGMLFLFAPIIYEQSRLKPQSLESLRFYAGKLSTTKSLNCYLIALFITTILTGVAFVYQGLTQIIVSAVKIKWFFFLLFGYLAILKKEKQMIFLALVGFEFISGFYSFFSEFKTVIYYLGILLVGLIATINFKQVVIAAGLAAGMIYVGLLWTSVKGEYRNFLNKGTAQQVAAVSKDEALEKLLGLSTQTQEKGTEGAVKDMLDRLQYTYHFAKTLERVPDFIPFQKGANWLANIEFSTTPRFLNPDKPNIDNSVKATKYTGIRYATARQGVSFSLGYFAEFYVDFGKFLMMPGIMLLGFIYARLYRYFLIKPSNNPIFNYAITGAFFFEFSNYEMDGTFLSGRLFASIITFMVLIFFFSKPLLRFIRVPDAVKKPD
jgi:hypothetical protein